MVSARCCWWCWASALLVSIFQAATQIHEQTLSFVPKIVAAVAVLMFDRAVDAKHGWSSMSTHTLISIPTVVG